MINMLPYWICSDLEFFKQHEDITVQKVCVSDEEPVVLNVTMDIYFEPQFAVPVNDLIVNPEQITISYRIAAEHTAPVIFADRNGFPDDLPHLNLRDPLVEEKSLCLWRSGTDKLYLQHGIARTIEVLQGWLADARDGRLLADGWEPAPISQRLKLYCDIGVLQELAEEYAGEVRQGRVNFWKPKDWPFGIGRMLALPSNKVSLSPKKKPYKKTKNERDEMITTCYLVSSEKEKRYSQPVRYHPRNLDELTNLLDQDNMKNLVVLLKKRNFKIQGGVLVMVAFRRPVPLQLDIPGLSSTSAAANEILSLWIDLVGSEIIMETVALLSNPNAKLLASISGNEVESPSLHLIGCGAVGSSVAVMLARSGVAINSLWDEDVLTPHNNARHECQTGKKNLFLTKSILLKDKIVEISGDYNPDFHPMNFSEEHLQFVTDGHLIETTGDNRLEATWLRHPVYPVHRFMLAGGGTVGLLQTQNMLNDITQASVLDLEALVYLEARNNAQIREWLSFDNVLSNRLLGFGCSSATMELPWSTVQYHCAALLPALRRNLNKKVSAISLSFLTREGIPNGYVEVDVPLFKTVQKNDQDETDWTIRWSEDVESVLRSGRGEALPKEAGGFLVGLINLEEHYITIVAATLTQGVASCSSLALPPAQNDPSLHAILSSSNQKLGLLGTWHSHPRQSAAPSLIDSETFSQIAEDRFVGPCVMMIVADEELNVMVASPKNWVDSI